MKKQILTVILGSALTSSATPITGNIGFVGVVDLNTRNVDAATEAVGWQGCEVAGDKGTFASAVPIGDSVSLAAPWFFNSGVLLNFWQVGGFSFDITTSKVYFQGSGFLNVQFTGKVSGHGYDVTDFTGAFSTQNPAANGGYAFTESMSFVQVPIITSNKTYSTPDNDSTAPMLAPAPMLALLAASVLVTKKVGQPI
jgi:hypothetical protein